MERKVGEVFTYNGKTYQVVKSDTCKDCAFSNIGCNSFQTLVAGTCIPEGRKDNINVAFREINNMENNQLIINIPKGMEIDLEKSDLAKGIVKFKKKNITYDDILQAYATDFGGIKVPNHCIDKILAISQLMNIARYYNGNWNYEVNGSKCGYMIAYDRSIKNFYYKVNIIYPNTDVYYGNIIFKNEADAQVVIDNPNFRDILNAIYKN